MTNIWEPLVGKWRGEGKGHFPTISDFVYFESLQFEQRDPLTLHYMQKTDKQYADQAVETSHWESGFIRLLEDNSLELINVQSGGRGEVLTGHYAQIESGLQLTFRSQSQINDARMIDTTRIFTLSGNMLTYQMQMHTTAVNGLLPHLDAKLFRV